MKKIPLATLAKAQKKLAKSQRSGRLTGIDASVHDVEADADGNSGQSHRRRGREAPRRDMDPNLLLSRERVQEQKARRTSLAKPHRDNKHA